MTEELYRALGRLEEGHKHITDEIVGLRHEIRNVTELANQARGGLRMLTAVGVIAGAIGSAITGFFLKVKGGA